MKPESINITDTFLWYTEITYFIKLLTVQNICTYIYFTKKINTFHCYANCMTQITIWYLTPTVYCLVCSLIVQHFTSNSAALQSSSTFLIRDGRYWTYQPSWIQYVLNAGKGTNRHLRVKMWWETTSHKFVVISTSVWVIKTRYTEKTCGIIYDLCLEPCG